MTAPSFFLLSPSTPYLYSLSSPPRPSIRLVISNQHLINPSSLAPLISILTSHFPWFHRCPFPATWTSVPRRATPSFSAHGLQPHPTSLQPLLTTLPRLATARISSRRPRSRFHRRPHRPFLVRRPSRQWISTRPPRPTCRRTTRCPGRRSRTPSSRISPIPQTDPAL